MCSKHFADSVKGKVKLKKIAVPTIGVAVNINTDRSSLGQEHSLQDTAVTEPVTTGPSVETLTFIEDQTQPTNNLPVMKKTHIFPQDNRGHLMQQKPDNSHLHGDQQSTSLYDQYSSVVEIDITGLNQVRHH